MNRKKVFNLDMQYSAVGKSKEGRKKEANSFTFPLTSKSRQGDKWCGIR